MFSPAPFTDIWSFIELHFGRVLENPSTALMALLAFTVLYTLRVGFKSNSRPRQQRPNFARPREVSSRSFSESKPNIADPTTQMEYVARVDFEPWPLMNKSEYQVFLHLETAVRETDLGLRLMAQTSLGEIIRPKRSSASAPEADLAFRSINSKRLDFVVIDRFGIPILAVEYHGGGHYDARTFMRDAVKREVLRKARVQLLEIPSTYDKQELLDTFRRRLREVAGGTQ